MELADLKKSLEDTATEIKNRLEKAEGQAKDSGTIAGEVKTEVKNLTERHETLQKQIDDLEVLIQKQKNLDGGQQKKSFTELFEEAVEQNERFKTTKRGTLEIKAPVDMLSTGAGSVLTGDVIEPDRQPGIVMDPERNVRIRSFISTSPTTSNSISYIQEQNFQGEPGMVAEGAASPQLSFELAEITEPVKKIGAHLITSREMLDDIPMLMGWIRGRLASKLKLKEDTQILYGDGLGQNLNGLNTLATAFATSKTVPNPNNFDVLRLAVLQARVAEFGATRILINPTDGADMDLVKDSAGNYILPLVIFNGRGKQVVNVPIVENTAVTAGNFLLGDFVRGAQLFDRKQLSIEVSDSHDTQFVEDKVTVKISERIVLATYNTAAFIKGAFSTAITEITPV